MSCRTSLTSPGRGDPVRLAGLSDKDFNKQTNQFDESLGVQQEVLWLEIPVDDALAVQVLEGLDHTGHAEARCQVIKVAPG